jgi:hypothetical protein
MATIDVGDMVTYNPSGSLRCRTPGDDEGFHIGIVVAKQKHRDDRKINYEILWDDTDTIYGYYREELKVVSKAGPHASR